MRRAVKFSILALIAVVLSWLTVQFGNIIFGWSLYNWFFRKIQATGGLPDAMASALAIWCLAAIIIAGPAILLSLFAFGGRRRRAVLIAASAVSLGIMSLYLLGGLRPKDYLFNPATGESNYVYGKDMGGNITLFPKEQQFDPMTGTKLAPLDATTAQEYRRQQGIRAEQEKQIETLRREQTKLANDKIESDKRQIEIRKQEEELAREEAEAHRAQKQAIDTKEAASQRESETREKQENLQRQIALFQEKEATIKTEGVSSPQEDQTVQPETSAPHKKAPGPGSLAPHKKAPEPTMTQPTTINFSADVICDSDKWKNLDYSVDTDRNVIVLPLTEGCYGALVTLPENWDDWRFQNATNEVGWVAFIFVNEHGDRQNITPTGMSGSHPEKILKIPPSLMKTVVPFRLQGHGIIRLLRTAP